VYDVESFDSHVGVVRNRMRGLTLAEIQTLTLREKALCRRGMYTQFLHIAGLYDAEQITMLTTATLARDLSVSEAHAKHIRHIVERAIAPSHSNIWDILHMDTLCVPGTPYQDDVSPCVSSPVAWFTPTAGPRPLAAACDFVSSGSAALDQCMGGGFAKGMVSELVGESASGKTQLILYTTVCTALGLSSEPASYSALCGGPGQAVALITTHGRSAASHMVRRMVDMTEHLVRPWYLQHTSLPADQVDARVNEAVQRMLANVFLACALTFESMEHVLCYTLPGLMTRMRNTTLSMPLIVIDSIPPLFQEDAVDPDQEIARHHSVRAARLHTLALRLKRLAAGTPTASHAVVVTNHVKDAFASDTALVRHALAHAQLPLSTPAAPCRFTPTEAPPVPFGLQAAHFQGLLACIPCAAPSTSEVDVPELKSAQLGLVWSNCINARYLMAVMPVPHGIAKANAPRRLRTVFAPTCPSAVPEVEFLLTRAGIHARTLQGFDGT